MSIKLTNDVKISSQSLEMFVDTNNLIFSTTLNLSTSGIIYTAQQNCIVVLIGNASSMEMELTLDGKPIGKLNAINSIEGSYVLPMLVGQVLSSTNYRYCKVYVYGLK